MGFKVVNGNALSILPTLEAASVQTCITSPPYFGLRDYGVEGQIGLEDTPELYVAKLVEVFREVRRVLRDDGTLWLNLGDSYAATGGDYKNGSQGVNSVVGRTSPESCPENGRARRVREQKSWGIKPKDLIGIPWMVAFALRSDGWYLRSDIIWNKPNPMPESVTDRPTKAHEYIFLLSKSERYFYDADAVKEKGSDNKPWALSSNVGTKARLVRNDGNSEGLGKPAEGGFRNRRSVWTVSTQPYAEAHFATFPPALIKPCILAGCPADGLVLDPFNGAGTTGVVSVKYGRNYIGIELNKDYVEMSERRIRGAVLPLLEAVG